MTSPLGSIGELRRAYESGTSVAEVVAEVRRRVVAHDDPAMLVDGLVADLDARAAELDGRPDRSSLPLYGIPFVVKDNIDVAGVPTTAGCREFARRADRNATSVQLLLDAGAIVVAKTNLDQFATGLVGTRSPYGAPRNNLDPDVVPGGSSSGSATAVGAGIVPFSLGTDTAGSGRIPAAMNQIFGLKPTRGIVSTAGVVPACASLDCVSVFTRCVADAIEILELVDRVDDADPWRRRDRAQHPVLRTDRTRIGVLGDRDVADVDPSIVTSYRRLLTTLESRGAQLERVELGPFLEAGALLYGGPLVAERYASVGEFVATLPPSLVDPTGRIILDAGRWSAAEYHRARARILELQIEAAPVWRRVDVVAMPSVPFAPTRREVDDAPVAVNDALGRFSTFANILDLASVVVPDRLEPSPGAGVTLHGPAGADRRLLALAAACSDEEVEIVDPSCLDVVVVGAHLEGQPLNHQLTELGGVLRRRTTTAPVYRLWALPDGRRPALEQVDSGGAAIDVEVWSLPMASVGPFLEGVAPPLAIGRVRLVDGSAPAGFVCEAGGLSDAKDITASGGWRSWLTSRPA